MKELVKSRYKGYKKVRGIGINDAPEDYVVVKYEYIDGKRVKVWECPFYSDWTNMLTRCTSEDGKYSYEYQNNHNYNYVGVSCIADWLSFWTFRSWAIEQDWEGNSLDKDLLGDGSYYSPDTCCYLPQLLNGTIATKGKNGLPIGVSKNPTGKTKYKANATCNGMKTPIKYFDDILSAHNYWKESKIKLLLPLVDNYYTNGVIDLRIYKGILSKISRLQETLTSDTLIYHI